MVTADRMPTLGRRRRATTVAVATAGGAGLGGAHAAVRAYWGVAFLTSLWLSRPRPPESE